MRNSPRALGGSLVAAALIFCAGAGVKTGVAGALNVVAHDASTPATSQQLPLLKASAAFHEIAKKALPAVVSLNVTRSVKDPLEGAGLPGMVPPDGPEGSEGDTDGGPEGRGGMAVGMGSGVIIRADGMVLTNHHVVEDATKIVVTLDEKHKFPGKVVGSDPKTDLAVVKIQSPRKDLPTLGFGDSDQIDVGDWAVAIGSPFGLNRSVTSGIISAKGRASMGILDIEDFIQTDAPINPGNSGGPLLNLDGQVIGINTAIFSQGQGFVGIGFAIPAKIARDISAQIIHDGHVIRGWVGVAAQDLDEDLAHYFKSPRADAALVSQVSEKGPAREAGLREGDVVLSAGPTPVHSASELKKAIGTAKVGSTLPVTVARLGSVRSLDLHIQEEKQPKPPTAQARPSQEAGRAAPGQSAHPYGLVVEDIPPEAIRMLNLPIREGVIVVGVEPGSPAFEAGMSPGDIILKSNGTPVRTSKDFSRSLRAVGKSPSVLYVMRGPDEKVFVPIKNVA